MVNVKEIDKRLIDLGSKRGELAKSLKNQKGGEMTEGMFSRKLNGLSTLTLMDVLGILKYFNCKFEDIFGGVDDDEC